jgi:hypothetical protein
LLLGRAPPDAPAPPPHRRPLAASISEADRGDANLIAAVARDPMAKLVLATTSPRESHYRRERQRKLLEFRVRFFSSSISFFSRA